MIKFGFYFKGKIISLFIKASLAIGEAAEIYTRTSVHINYTYYQQGLMMGFFIYQTITMTTLIYVMFTWMGSGALILYIFYHAHIKIMYNVVWKKWKNKMKSSSMFYTFTSWILLNKSDNQFGINIITFILIIWNIKKYKTTENLQ